MKRRQATIEPERRGKRERAWHLRPWVVPAVFFLLLPYAVSYGSSGVSFTLVNRTQAFLHAVINNETIVYIPPGVAITRETSSAYDVAAEVTYSPGQGKTGKAFRTFQAVVHVTQTGTHSDRQASDCSGSPNTCESVSTSTAQTTTTIDPITWVVTADTLSSH